MAAEEVNYRLGITAMPLHAQAERFYSLQENPAVIRTDAGAQVAQRHQSHAQGEGNWVQVAKIVGITEPVVGGVRFVVDLELRVGPVELAGIYDDAADSGAVPAHPFGQ